MDISWLKARPDADGEPAACHLGAGLYYLTGRSAVGTCWAQRGERLYRLEVEGTAPTRFEWRILRQGRLIARGNMRPPRLGGLREALTTARELCEQAIRLDTTLGAPGATREVGEKALDRVQSGRKSASLRFAAARAALALRPVPQGGPELAGQRLRWARCRKGWPLAAMAVRGGISTATAQRMEVHASGRQIGLEFWLRLAAALGVDAAWLLLGRGTHDQAAPALGAAAPQPERLQSHA